MYRRPQTIAALLITESGGHFGNNKYIESYGKTYASPATDTIAVLLQGGADNIMRFQIWLTTVLLMHAICLYCLTTSIYHKMLGFTFSFGLDQSPKSKLSKSGPFTVVPRHLGRFCMQFFTQRYASIQCVKHLHVSMQIV